MSDVQRTNDMFLIMYNSLKPESMKDYAESYINISDEKHEKADLQKEINYKFFLLSMYEHNKLLII